jgi:hypothetical protein
MGRQAEGPSVIAAWLFKVFGTLGLKIMWISLAVLAVVAVLFGAKRAGRQAERMNSMERLGKVYREQLQDAANRPRTRLELRKRLLDGNY